MNKKKLKEISFYPLYGLLWTIILLISSILFKTLTTNNMKNILFVEGAMYIFFAILSGILGLSSTTFENNDYDYLSNIALEEKNLEKKTIILRKIKTALGIIPLSLAGFFCIFISLKLLP
ncbi:hypothetical protein [Clostridium massiliamazoniense]|uniref:hypothetical protein n=1 Tax=Clostridium massiliamazoniense TaxID=1347366 RepID=UPI0006D8600C|nr:hypothetical protein [Clostridium massiliamazoniense]